MIGSAWVSALLGLASAASWGAGDFCGGLATKRAGVYQVVIGSQWVGLVAVAILAVLTGERPPSIGNLLGCGLAGLLGVAGLLALYQALADGRMGIAAPISGVLSAMVPVLAGAYLEGWPGWLKLSGFGLALVGVWLVSRSASVAFQLRDLRLPLIAGLCFGTFIVLISRVNGGAVFWPLVAARLASLGALGLVAYFTHQPSLPTRSDWPLVSLSGLLDAGGNAFLVLAALAGRLDVAAVLSSLYPASTVLLAWFILKEQLSRWQLVGVLAALSAIVMITIPEVHDV
jgi:drug/metabolite transporter (DMT)-like permease